MNNIWPVIKNAINYNYQKLQLNKIRITYLIKNVKNSDYKKLEKNLESQLQVLDLIPDFSLLPLSLQTDLVGKYLKITRFVELLAYRKRNHNSDQINFLSLQGNLIIRFLNQVSDDNHGVKNSLLSCASWHVISLQHLNQVKPSISFYWAIKKHLSSNTYHHIMVLVRMIQYNGMPPEGELESLKKNFDTLFKLAQTDDARINYSWRRLFIASFLKDADYVKICITDSLPILQQSSTGQLNAIALARMLCLYPDSYEYSLNWLKKYYAKNSTSESLIELVTALKLVGEIDIALNFVNHFIEQYNDTEPLPLNLLRQKATLIRLSKQRSNADKVECFKELLLRAKNDMQSNDIDIATNASLAFPRILDAYNDMNYWNEITCIYNNAPVPQHPKKIKGLVVLAMHTANTTASALTIIPLLELKKRGYIVISLFSDACMFAPIDDEELNGISGSYQGITPPTIYAEPKHCDELYFDWDINWKDRQIMANGINFFQPIFEKVGRLLARFSIDLDNEIVVKYRAYDIIREIDRAIYLSTRIEKWAKKNKLPVRIISSISHFPPEAGFKIFCEAHGVKNNIEYVAFNPGYDVYFSNEKSKNDTTITALNLTTHHNSRSSFLGDLNEFEKWISENEQNYETFKENVETWLNFDRSDTPLDIAQNGNRDLILEKIETYRQRNKPVFLALGKIVYDLAVPSMGGPAHADIGDWITHTVEIMKNTDGLLLIKPHPLEDAIEIAQRPVERFIELINTEIPENVIVLSNSMFKSNELYNLIDLVLIWNGTSIVEFGSVGINCVACDYWAKHDYLVNAPQPDSKNHYEEIIRNPDIIPPRNEEYKKRCVLFLQYIYSNTVRKKNIYTRFSSSNLGRQGTPPEIYYDNINRYLSSGDPTINEIVDKFEF